MQVERRALYNSMRIHWQQNPTLRVEAWQVEDYRSLPIEVLFERLNQLGIRLDRNGLIAFAGNEETPEEFTETLVADLNLERPVQDQIYLLVFELWRRLLPEKRCLTIFCDELDYQINLYDSKNPNLEALQDVLAYLQQLLEEYTDSGEKPQKVFGSICLLCANDIESFIYDFIAEQIDLENYSYASDLFEGFFKYIQDTYWFEFLQARLLMRVEPEEANEVLRKMIRKASTASTIDFNFEVLAYLVQDGDKDLFISLARHTLGLIKVEEDLSDLMHLCADYYHCLDDEAQEKAILEILSSRSQNNPENPLSSDDPAFKVLKGLLRNK